MLRRSDIPLVEDSAVYDVRYMEERIDGSAGDNINSFHVGIELKKRSGPEAAPSAMSLNQSALKIGSRQLTPEIFQNFQGETELVWGTQALTVFAAKAYSWWDQATDCGSITGAVFNQLADWISEEWIRDSSFYQVWDVVTSPGDVCAHMSGTAEVSHCPRRTFLLRPPVG